MSQNEKARIPPEASSSLVKGGAEADLNRQAVNVVAKPAIEQDGGNGEEIFGKWRITGGEEKCGQGRVSN
jgi:hypothetical protein